MWAPPVHSYITREHLLPTCQVLGTEMSKAQLSQLTQISVLLEKRNNESLEHTVGRQRVAPSCLEGGGRVGEKSLLVAKTGEHVIGKATGPGQASLKAHDKFNKSKSVGKWLNRVRAEAAIREETGEKGKGADDGPWMPQ